MNPCPENQRPLAWMAAGALDAPTAATLREHLESCPRCRQYWESMAALSERLNSAELPQAQLPDSFHARLVRKIHHDQNAAPVSIWLAAVRQLWRHPGLATATAGAALALATLVWVQNHRENKEHTTVPMAVHTIREAPPQRIPPSTLASYHQAANVSLENLDAVLAREVAPNRPTVETFTFSSLLARSLED